ncbi:MAG TPA: hypothetical protein VL261_03390 [Nitrospira sp.]|jgi:hypothetical protein|nr:hypothetical protein [Nitrospira sp.]
MKRWTSPLAIGMVVLYAALAIGAANCLVLHAEQPQGHHHSQSRVAHSALCAWACQVNPTVMVAAPIPLAAISTIVARLYLQNSATSTAPLASLLTSRAPPVG